MRQANMLDSKPFLWCKDSASPFRGFRAACYGKMTPFPDATTLGGWSICKLCPFVPHRGVGVSWESQVFCVLVFLVVVKNLHH